MKNHPRLHPGAGRLLVALLLAAPAAAQLVSGDTTTTRNAAGEEVVYLSPFTVSTTSGWSANDTLSATRTKQALKDVPVNIDAITADFIEDLGIGRADEVIGYIAGVFVPGLMENDNQQDNLAFRGLAQRGNLSRNYFRWYAPSDTYNVERIDFGKGSNSLIFGEGEPGGQGTVFTKRAQFRNFGRVMAQVTDEGAYRVQLDLNRRLRDNLAVRVNLIERIEKTFQDASEFGLSGVTGTVTWEPFPRTQVRVEYEQGDFENSRGYAGVNLREISGRSRAFQGGVTYTSDGEYFYAGSTARPLVPNTDFTHPAVNGVTVNRLRSANPDLAAGNRPSGATLSLFEGGFIDVIMRNAAGLTVGTKRFAGLPKEYNIRGAFDRQGRPFDTFTATIEQRIGEVGLEFAYNRQSQRQERTDNVFSNTIGVEVNGRPFTESTLDNKTFETLTHAFRGTAVAKFDRWKNFQQLLVVSGEYLEDNVLNNRWIYANTAFVDGGLATDLSSLDRARIRLYLDDPQFYSRALFDRLKAPALPNVPGLVTIKPIRRQDFISADARSGDGTRWRQGSSASASLSGSYWGGRIQSLVGLRRDFNRVWDWKSNRREGLYREDVETVIRSKAQPGDYVENKNLRTATTSLSTGLVYRLTKDINVYGTYSESFLFQDAFTFDKTRIGPAEGETMELGVKGNLWGDALAVTLGVFQIDRLNSIKSFDGVGPDLTADELEDLMNPNSILPTDPAYKGAMRDRNSASRNYLSTESSKGFDVTLMAHPVSGLQLRLTLAMADVKGTPDLSALRGYYDAAVRRGDESPVLLADTKQLLDMIDLPNRPTGARAAKWSASWVVDYAFRRDLHRILRGVRVGLNGSWRDNYLLGVTSTGREIEGGQTHLVNAYLMRDQRIFNQRVRVRLGVRNLTDLENGDLRKTSFGTLDSGAVAYRFSYVMPPQYDLSVTVDF
jgi:outer membrane receptor protein involved in Fe transport